MKLGTWGEQGQDNDHADFEVYQKVTAKDIKQQLNYAISQVDMLKKDRFQKRDIKFPQIKASPQKNT